MRSPVRSILAPFVRPGPVRSVLIRLRTFFTSPDPSRRRAPAPPVGQAVRDASSSFGESRSLRVSFSLEGRPGQTETHKPRRQECTAVILMICFYPPSNLRPKAKAKPGLHQSRCTILPQQAACRTAGGVVDLSHWAGFALKETTT